MHLPKSWGSTFSHVYRSLFWNDHPALSLMIIEFWFLSVQDPWSDWFLWLSHWLIWIFFFNLPCETLVCGLLSLPEHSVPYVLVVCWKTRCEAGVFLTPLPRATDFAPRLPQQQWIFVTDPEQEEQTGFVSVYCNGMALLVKDAFTLTWLVGSWSSPVYMADEWMCILCVSLAPSYSILSL